MKYLKEIRFTGTISNYLDMDEYASYNGEYNLEDYILCELIPTKIVKDFEALQRGIPESIDKTIDGTADYFPVLLFGCDDPASGCDLMTQRLNINDLLSSSQKFQNNVEYKEYLEKKIG